MAKYYSRMALDRTLQTPTQYLSRPGGRIAFDVAGSGPLVLLVPGMGDLRSAYRFLAPALVAAGYRVATTDLRGHGDSDPGFPCYGDVETAGDITALIEALGGPAVVVGNSMAAGAGAYAAADRPDLVSALALLGPFVRDPEAGALARAIMRIALAPPWAALAWKAYLPRLYAGRRPEDLDAYLATVVASMKRPGYAQAFSRTTRTTHEPAAARLGEVEVPTLIVMGEADPDFADPRAEAEWIAQAVSGRVVMVPESGHYPHSQQPERVLAAITAFLAEAGLDA